MNLDLLVELEPVVEDNLARHLDAAKEWMPHEYVPWDEGRDFVAEPWDIGQSKLSPVARTAFEVNLLTEDNLPSYHYEIAISVRPGRGVGHVGAPVDGRRGPACDVHARLPACHPRS